MHPDITHLLASTAMLDYQHPTIQQLIKHRQWHKLTTYEAIGAAYNFVRDDIHFGYNADDTLPASAVLEDGYGQCNTKGTLLMALLRALGIPTRIHGFTIDNELQRGAIPTYLMPLAPQRILHSWVEIYFNERWINLEGYIIDRTYLRSIQQRETAVVAQKKAFCGYGIATPCLAAPSIDWQGKDTYIQKEGIAEDFGLFDTPDQFYNQSGSNLSGIKKIAYRYVLRHLINRHVNKLRNAS